MKKTIQVQMEAKEVQDAIIEKARASAGQGAGSCHVTIATDKVGSIEGATVIFQTELRA